MSAEAVVDVASDVFASHGYVGTTLDSVAARLGVSRQGVLHYFPSKRELFLAVLERHRAWAQRVATQPARPDESPLSPLRAFVGASEAGREHVRLVHVLIGEAIAGDAVARDFVIERTSLIDEQVSARVSVADARGLLRSGWTVDTAVEATSAVLTGLQSRALLGTAFAVDVAFDAFLSSVTRSRHPDQNPQNSEYPENTE